MYFISFHVILFYFIDIIHFYTILGDFVPFHGRCNSYSTDLSENRSVHPCMDVYPNFDSSQNGLTAAGK